MTKVHMISTNDIYEFETWINDFIKDKKVVDIRFTSLVTPTKVSPTNFTGGVSVNSAIIDRAMIIYEED